MSKIITLEELAQHTSLDAPWVAMHGHVFEVKNWLHDHPGGQEILMTSAGRDCSLEYEGIRHSQEARDLALSKYLIGRLKGQENVEFYKEGKYPIPGNFAGRKKGSSSGDDDNTMLIVAAGAVVAGLAFWLYKKSKA